MELFKEALKKKYRFNYRGAITTEDLFDLPVEALDEIYTGLRRHQKSMEEDSLLKKESIESKEIDNKIEIVKTIVNDKLAEKERVKKMIATKEKNQKILEIIAKKENASLEEKSIDDLKKMLEEDSSDAD